ncbi:MAG: WYL domain-containing protein [Deltaproteobacteria bacterium]|nr:WYL domain-containing protein [Deltaproteobacteria bacterium]MBI3386491.1 WYL domain-containing protein [Deltaproteobacteria bacterium]
MRADRLLSMLLLLQHRGRMTAPQLAEQLEVSERTIYRDLDALSAAGVPVYAERGPRGGCVLRPGYRTDLTGLNQSEVASLFAGTARRALDDVGLGTGLRSALVKLEAGLPEARRTDAARVRQRLHVDAAAWFGADERSPQLMALRDAVFADRTVRLTYLRANGGAATRRVDPLGLVVKGGIWYLVTVTAGDTRVHRVSRIRRVVVTKDRFERPRQFDLATFWSAWSRDFIASIPDYRVRLRATARALGLLPQIFGDRVRTAIEAAGPPHADGVMIELTFDSREAACGRLLGLGTLVEVIEPRDLRDRLRQTAQAVSELYGGEGRRRARR